MSSGFPVDPNYAKLLREQGLSIAEILRRARLPENLFPRRDAALSTEEYLRFMTSSEDAAQGTDLSIRLADHPAELPEEGTTFQKQLNHTRALLAKNYLKKTALASEDIAFLLGYQDVTSFFRAFSLWNGQGVSDYKANLAQKC